MHFTLGSDPANHIALQGSGIAARHARITVIENTVVIEDLDTVAGTFVNGLRLKTAVLTENDILVLGTTPIDLKKHLRWQNGLPVGIIDPLDFSQGYQSIFNYYENTYTPLKTELKKTGTLDILIGVIPYIGNVYNRLKGNSKTEKLDSLEEECKQTCTCPNCKKPLAPSIGIYTLKEFKKLEKCPHNCGAKWST